MTQPEYDVLWPGGPRFVRYGALPTSAAARAC